MCLVIQNQRQCLFLYLDQQLFPTFSAITKKFDIATQTLRKSAAIQKTAVSSNQGNKTTEKNLEISLKLPAHCKYNNYIKQWTSILKNRSNLSISCIRFSKWNV